MGEADAPDAMALPESEIVGQLIKRALPGSESAGVERVPEGGSTRVYRVRREHDILYVRVLPEDDASFAPEALVHRLLRESGARVPEVVLFEHHESALRRSVMVTTEISGDALGSGASEPEARRVLVEAGRDLAVINNIPVRGFGWVRRDLGESDSLEAEFASCSEWVHGDLAADVDALEQAGILREREARAVEEVVRERGDFLGSDGAFLAHGDFDATHVFQRDGAYTGIIDFGEIRGADRFYDLGHFQIENRSLLPYLLEGYGELAPLPTDYRERIHLWSLLIAVGRLGRGLVKGRRAYAPAVEAIRRATGVLDS